MIQAVFLGKWNRAGLFWGNRGDWAWLSDDARPEKQASIRESVL
jgi:hypothetical protein